LRRLVLSKAREYCAEKGVGKSAYYGRLEDIAGLIAAFLNAAPCYARSTPAARRARS
jgi:hypothetical protein